MRGGADDRDRSSMADFVRILQAQGRRHRTAIQRRSRYAGGSIMPKSPSIVPGKEQDTVYLVLDDFGQIGQAWRETDVSRASFESVIADMMQDQFSNPARVIGFNIAEGWVRDVSEDIARELRQRCADQGRELPAHMQDFVERHDCHRGDRAEQSQ
jgi:hypothetical protein